MSNEGEGGGRKVLAYDDGRGTRPGVEASWSQVGLAFAGVGIVVGPVVLWLLQELKYAPYRPPADMSTLLGAGERAIVSWVQVFILVAWGLCVWLVLRALLRRLVTGAGEGGE